MGDTHEQLLFKLVGEKMSSKLASRQKKGLYLSLSFSLITLIAILYFTTSEKTWESLQTVQPAFLFLALLIVLFSWLIEGLRLKYIVGSLEENRNISLFSCVKVFLITLFFAGITPMALGEWPALIYYLHRSGVSLAESTASMVIRTVLTKFMFMVVAVALLISYDGRISGGAALNYFFRSALGFLVLSSFIYFIVLLKPEIIWVGLRTLKRVPFLRRLAASNRLKDLVKRLREEAEQFQLSLGRLGRSNRKRLIIPALLSFGYWFTYFLIAPVLLVGLGLDFEFWRILIWQFLIVLIIVYTPVPGGSGFVEISLAAFFAAYVPAHIIGIFVVAWRFFTYYINLIFGGILVTGRTPQ
ncbi:MAG: hypothetical protein CVU88_01150 [Firmicutes bacterium HGW-Firmicutes-13]|nr:MAG: hypothetical protein CVU88_01150 [Firmicutes bacterium HGW-Firmicutes-13]